MFRNIVVALTVLAFTGCHSMRPIQDFSPSVIQQRVEVGDRVHIVATTGGTYDLEVTKVENNALYGADPNGKRYKVMYAAIKTISASEISGWKTATAVGATVTVVVVGLALAALYALFHTFDP